MQSRSGPSPAPLQHARAPLTSLVSLLHTRGPAVHTCVPRPSPRASARASLSLDTPLPDARVTPTLGSSESSSLMTLPTPVRPCRPPSPRLVFGARSEIICVPTRLRWSSPDGRHLCVLSAALPALPERGLARSRRSVLRLQVQVPDRHRRWLREAVTRAPNPPGSAGEEPGWEGRQAPLPLRVCADADGSHGRGRHGQAGPGLRQTDEETRKWAPGPGLTDGSGG